MDQKENDQSLPELSDARTTHTLKYLIGVRHFTLVYGDKPILEIGYNPEVVLEVLLKAISELESIGHFQEQLSERLRCCLKVRLEGERQLELQIGPGLITSKVRPVKLPLDGSMSEAVLENEFLKRATTGHQFVSINLPSQLVDMMHRLLAGAVISTLSYEVPAELMKLINPDSLSGLNKFLPVHRKGWQKRPASPKDQDRIAKYVEQVKKRYKLGELIQKTFKAHKNHDWKMILKANRNYPQLLEGCDERIVEVVLELIASRFVDKDKRSRAIKEGIRPLAIACEIAARELDFKDSSGHWYKPSALITEFNKAGGRIRN